MDCENKLGHGLNNMTWAMSERADALLTEGYKNDGSLEEAEALEAQARELVSQAEKADKIGADVLLKKAKILLHACYRLAASEREIHSFCSHGYWDEKDYSFAHSGGYLSWQKNMLPVFKLATE
jgi:rhodanese-related sulfurtransferase